MSAPNQGRQSPDPERQTGSQIHDAPGSNPNDQGAGKGQDSAKDSLKDLESNPKHILEDAAKAKVSKGS